MSQRDCLCGHEWAVHQHHRAGDDCSRCACPYYAGPALIHPNTARVVATVMILAGTGFILGPWHPLAGAALCCLGLGAMWRASIGEREARGRVFDGWPESADGQAGRRVRDGED